MKAYCSLLVLGLAIIFSSCSSMNHGGGPNAMVPLSTKNITSGLGSYLDTERDFGIKKDYAVNSWFTIGHFTAEGHTISILYHTMILSMPIIGSKIQSAVSVTDETSGWYEGEDWIGSLQKPKEKGSSISFTLPNATFEGSVKGYSIKARTKNAEINISVNGSDKILFNAGSGMFPMLGMNINEYSIPRMTASGYVVIEGHKYNVDGNIWFDRQWQNMPIGNKGSIDGNWTWMGINLDNGDSISLWSANANSGNVNSWATILRKDGTHTIVAIEPLIEGADNYWLSETSNQYYPTHWKVKIPAMSAILDVTPHPQKQEVVSHNTALTKYEGASEVQGIYQGEKVSGYGYVELVGSFQK